MNEIGHFIDGARVAGTSSRKAEVFNPATGQVSAHLSLAGASEAAADEQRAPAGRP